MAFDLQNVHDSVKGYKHKYIYFFIMWVALTGLN